MNCFTGGCADNGQATGHAPDRQECKAGAAHILVELSSAAALDGALHVDGVCPGRLPGGVGEQQRGGQLGEHRARAPTAAAKSVDGGTVAPSSFGKMLSQHKPTTRLLACFARAWPLAYSVLYVLKSCNFTTNVEC